jgi:hypothetical protein
MKRGLILILIGFICVIVSCHKKQSQAHDTRLELQKKVLCERVKTEFLHAWDGYKKYAWGHDELKPISKGFRDWYKTSLLMTPIDAFSTMKMMDLKKEAEEVKELILNRLTFDLDIKVQFFEINIRLLGGLLSAHHLDGDKRFLKLAIDLANRLMPAFNSPTGMPYLYVNLKTGKTKGPMNNPAEIGTTLLEWGTLSKLTGNPVYYQKAKKAIQVLFQKRSKHNLLGTIINVETGIWQNTDSHIGARIDSCYEYLLKGWLMFGDTDLKDMWLSSIKAINKHLADEVESGFWYGQVNMHSAKRIGTNFGALEAFFPAVLALSGDLARAEKLQDSCYRMWMLHGIEPETLDYSTMQTISDYYMLRPENIESAYYLYYFTQNPKYLKMGEVYLESIIKYCRNDVAYCHLKSVKTKEKQDAMQSFFLAETLKYLYLLFAPKETFSFEDSLFNTEAHPLKVWVK